MGSVIDADLDVFRICAEAKRKNLKTRINALVQDHFGSIRCKVPGELIGMLILEPRQFTTLAYCRVKFRDDNTLSIGRPVGYHASRSAALRAKNLVETTSRNFLCKTAA